jgi:hypothetical protein
MFKYWFMGQLWWARWSYRKELILVARVVQ